MKYVEALESLIGGLEERAVPTAGKLSGKELKSKNSSPSTWVAIDSNDSLHLLVAAEPEAHKEFKRLSKFKQRFLTFSIKKWVISGQAAREYLDICCIADRKSEYRRPFLYFCSDCLAELEANQGEPAQAIYQVAQRWHRFWVMPGQGDITPEWIKGLLGECWFLLELVKTHGSGAIQTWTGPEGRDQDFQGNGIGIEIKTTETMPPILKISNLTQLDFTLFKRLWLVVFSVTSKDDGQTLPDALTELEKAIEDVEAKELLWQKVAIAGYRRHLEGRYREYAYGRTKKLVYEINEKFPSLKRQDLKKPLDDRIQSIRYSVKVVGVASVVVMGGKFTDDVKTLCR